MMTSVPTNGSPEMAQTLTMVPLALRRTSMIQVARSSLTMRLILMEKVTKGPSIAQIYRRSLLVVWPSSQTLDNAKRAGFEATLSLLKLRMEGVSTLCHSTPGTQQQHQQQTNQATSLSSGATHNAAFADAVATLQACVQLLENSPKKRAQPGWYSSSSKPSITPVLQLGVRALKLGVVESTDSVQKLVTLAMATEECLADKELVEALTAAAGMLDASAVGPPLACLAAHRIVQQPMDCITFIQSLSAHPELQTWLVRAALAAGPAAMVDDLLMMAMAIPGLPEMQQQVVNKLVAALQGQDSAQVVEKVAAALHKLNESQQLQQQLTTSAAAAVVALGPVKHLDSCIQILKATQQLADTREQLVQALAAALRSIETVWQASTALQLVAVLQDSPKLRQLLQAAVTETLFSSYTLLSNQTDASMLQLSTMLLAGDELSSAYYRAFATAVTQRPGNYGLLKQLLESAQIQTALAMPEVQQLVSCQISNLERMCVVPPFSWHMPEAKLPSHPEVSCTFASAIARLAILDSCT
eukprot:GHUV01015221.1.p1 GENE.GHUV01015221.1~~GHUV01015221.1.p1  ORF type:complete len:529 (+),score=164.92 GHUV01015221.1:965-2551(+)